jgi:exo-beta-1,3-glucanase (GH17 family)/cellulose synthase/poly-beta-1,6-N-acetylglucosamine synthase-like glycosyltransferase
MFPSRAITISNNRGHIRLRDWLIRLRLTPLFGGGRLRIALALVMVVGGSVLFWASRDYTIQAPEWDGQVRGIAYNPSHLFSESDQLHVTPEHIARDMEQLSHLTSHIRTYTVAGGMDKVPEIARRYGITVTLGIWIGPNLVKNEKEIALGIKTALENRRTVDRVVVGNETQLRGDVSPDRLNSYIRRVRAALPARIKVTTAEPWSTWMLTPEIGKYVDVIFVHLLPYWENADIRGSLKATEKFYDHIQAEFPNKPVIVGEAGWPSEGRTRGNAVASVANEAWFVRAFVQFAMEKGWDYYLIEAYDQPWKNRGEGAVGAYWGLFDATGHPKFAFTGLLRTFPQWRTYALMASVLSLLLGLLILGRMPRVRQTGYLVMGGMIVLVSTGLLVLIDATALEYIDPADIAALVAMSPLVLLACAVILTEGIELAASLWRVDRREVRLSVPGKAPRVSIHVPTYNEPPGMVIATLNALTRLDYDNFEVILLDNNTADPDVWRPVEAHCRVLDALSGGPRFRFFHFEQVKGFKGGALNRALALTDRQAEFVAVIDSDYQVAPYWLRRAMSHFAAPSVALVQGPQDYHDSGENLFKAMAYEEYRGFFHIGMVERNEHNAIIQHGTMTIVRKDALEAVDGWSQWCITEDSELGLKLFEAGYEAVYVPQAMGKGVMPDTLEAFMTQRYRWVYGAMQILKRHARAIFMGGTKLSWSQRYQFLSGWLPWISDGLGMVVTLVALVWTLLMWLAPAYIDVPMPALSAAALALFATKCLKTLLLYPPKVKSGLWGAGVASIAGLALAHTVGKAVWSGLLTSNKPFLRTPKCADPASFTQVFRVIWQEAILLVLLLAALVSMSFDRGFQDPAVSLWMVMLGVQAVPYAATFATACISAVANKQAVAVPQTDVGARKAA